MRKTAFVAVLLTFFFLLSSSAAYAASYGDFTGTNVEFLNVNDSTTSPGDPDGLFGGAIGPIVTGNQLIFFPTQFSASAVGGSSDLTSATLNLMIESSDGLAIDKLSISEVGDFDLSGQGTAATNVSVSFGGFVTVLEVDGQMVIPEIIGFSLDPAPSYELPGDNGSGLWDGEVMVDIAAMVPNATKVVLSLNNIMDANSEEGTTALIQKKVVNGPVLSVKAIVPGSPVPEPSAASLLGIGALVIARSVRRRSQR